MSHKFALEPHSYTPADLLAMPDSSSIELVNGQLVEKPVSALSAFVEAKLLTRIGIFCEAHKTAVVLSSTNGIRCFPNQPLKVRKPDVSVFKTDRFTDEHLLEGFVSIHPDIAVEVVSTNDEYAEVIEKVEEYLAVGVSLVWVIDPENRIVHIYRGDGSVAKLYDTGELTGENVLPGFACTVGELLPVRNLKRT